MPSVLPDGESVPPDGSLPVSALAELATRPLGIYLHVPFCRTRCGYCDFNTYTADESGGADPAGWVAAVHAELRLARRVLGSQAPPVKTVFVGGGTPTLLLPETMRGILGGVRESFGLAPDAEVTTEANPETVTYGSLVELRAAGFTRVSLGMQSAVEHVLATLDRVHTPQRAVEAAQWARRAGFEHVSLDLIYGTPGESLADWRASLDAALAAPIDHVSAYSLIVEPGTRMAARVRRGELPLPDDDDLAEKYLVAETALTGAGFANYETSNWARPGGQCRHNLGYWMGANWWGIGPGAHSHVGGVRFWNRKHPRSYAEELGAGRTPAQGREVLSREQRRMERVLLETRLVTGLPLSLLTDSERGRVAAVVAAGLATVVGDRLQLSVAGRLLADGVVRDLLD
ncbi:MAG: radical SAM family heme chaperone HemW [Arachnia sp.]